jgi:hypothetical protein
MTEETAQIDTEAATQAESSATDKLFDAGKETEDATKGGESPEVGKDESNDQADSSDTEDETKEADKSEDEKSEDKKDDGEESEEGDDKASDYGDVILPQDLPEGVEIDNELFDSVKEIGAKHQVPAEAMQEMVDMYAKRIADSDEALKNQWAQIEEGWKNDAKTDKEIGGDNFDTNVEKAKRAIETFGTPELKEALEQTRMGNHPEVIRLLSRIGEKITEDGSFDTGSGAGQRTRGDVLFDNTKP